MKSSFFSLRNSLIISVFLVFGLLSCSGSDNSSEKHKAYAQASVFELIENQSITDWWISDPVLILCDSAKPNENMQKAFFLKDEISYVNVSGKTKIPKVSISGKSLSWHLVSKADGIIDLNAFLGETSFAYAFALTEILADSAQKMLMGLGSDDGVKVFLNGEPVHENWIGRGVNRDDDIVELNLHRGSNQLLLKVQNMEYGWGFTLRRLPGEKIIEYAAAGDLDKVRYLISKNINVNAQNEIKLNALAASEIKGRTEMSEFLRANGAEEVEIPPFEELTNHLFRKVQTDTSPGAAVLFAVDDEIFYSQGFGYANIEERIKIDSKTKFRIGSVTKQFTAMAILKLEEAGKLNLDDKLSKFIPDFPRGNEVRIHQLLTHTSGIHSYTNQGDFADYVTKGIALEDLVEKIKSYEYDFDPGDKWMYSNSGYVILGYIIEKLSGMSYADYLGETFFTPMGMKTSGIYTVDAELSNEALGYTYEKGKPKLALNWDMSWAAGAGAIYSTVEDLFKWNKALYSGQVISDENLKKATSPAKLNNGKQASSLGYGYGLSMAEIRGMPCYRHTGGLHGFVAFLGYIPSKKATVAVLINSTPPPEGIGTMGTANAIFEYAFWEEMDEQQSFKADTTITQSSLEEYAGRYHYGRGAVMIIETKGDEVYAQMIGQPQFQVFPGGPDELFWKVVEAKIVFKRNETGEVIGATHYQGGQELEVTKLPEIVRINIDKSTLGDYAGKFDFGNGMNFEFSLEEDMLFISGDRFPKSELIPTGKKKFECREMDLVLQYNIDKAAPYEEVNVNMGGMIRDAPRIED